MAIGERSDTAPFANKLPVKYHNVRRQKKRIIKAIIVPIKSLKLLILINFFNNGKACTMLRNIKILL